MSIRSALFVILLFALGGFAYWQFGSSLFSSSPSGDTDITPPTISNVLASVADNTTVIISWETDELASSQVEYGTTDAYGSLSPSTPQNDPSSGTSTGVVNHSITLSGLETNTTYYYRVKSKDAAGNEATSTGDFTTGTSTG